MYDQLTVSYKGGNYGNFDADVVYGDFILKAPTGEILFEIRYVNTEDTYNFRVIEKGDITSYELPGNPTSAALVAKLEAWLIHLAEESGYLLKHQAFFDKDRRPVSHTLDFK